MASQDPAMLTLRPGQHRYRARPVVSCRLEDGQKTVVLNAPAMAVLASLDQHGSYVVPGDDPEKPRADLKRPWQMIAKRAGLEGVRLHDLRHTYASFGAGSGLGLPIIGKLLGHSQAATTHRYAPSGQRPAASRNGNDWRTNRCSNEWSINSRNRADNGTPALSRPSFTSDPGTARAIIVIEWTA
jgi:integrase